MSLTKVTYSMIQGQCANVLDFGASPTATATANTTAIQAAINSGASSVYFPEGTYAVNSEITISGNCYLFGDGIGQTIINATTIGASKAIFKVTNSKVGFSSMTLKGPSVASYVADECAIWFYDSTGPTKEIGFVENVEIYDVGSYGVLVEYFNKVTVNSCYIHDVGYAAVNVLSSYDAKITGNTIHTITPGTAGNAYGVTLSSRTGQLPPTRFIVDSNTIRNIPLWEGIDTHGGYDGVFSNNVVVGCKIGIVVTRDDNSVAPARVQVIGNTITKGDITFGNTSFGIVVAGTDDDLTAALSVVVCGNTISGMGVGNNEQGCISIQTTDSVTVANNVLRNVYGNGIAVRNSNTNLSIVGNTVTDVDSSMVGNIAGIKFYTGGNTGLVSDNYVDASDTYPLFISSASRSLTFGQNTFITSGSAPASGTEISGYQYAGAGLVAFGKTTTDIGSLSTGASTTLNIVASNCRPGDYCEVSSDTNLQGMILFGNVNSNDTVQVTVFNATAGSIDLPSASFYARVIRNGKS